MLQGTASHVGKTALAAALCRIYARRGYRVAPFKAQNMALNSFVTRDGGEMGRAQVYQARAAGVEPHVDMNPVLLKPDSDGTSQVVVLGRPVGSMTVADYHAYQSEVWPVVTAAYERLRATCDLIVIEGAGSAGEINLRDRDIVNMRMARRAGCPVLLVGDIDRGGVFASLIGHMEVFAEEERELVKAFVINKLRGDARLLDPGIEELRERTGVPTLGVVPLLEDWRGEEEDSVALDEPRAPQAPGAPLRIAVTRLPYLSNSTDFDALAGEPDVEVRYVTTPAELEGAAAIVVPGTKSTIADLAWLRRTGLAAALAARAAAGTPVIGVCGGYQMLGRRILDPRRVESAEPEVPGLGLLDIETTFAADKRTVRTEGELLAAPAPAAPAAPTASAPVPGAPAPQTPAPLGPPGTPVRGYEIHMGRTVLGPGAAPLLRLRAAARSAAAHSAGDPGADNRAAAHPGAAARDRLDGAVALDPSVGPVCGAYLHGLFDHPALRGAFLDRLRAARGLAPRSAAAPVSAVVSASVSAGDARLVASAPDDLDRLADHVEAHLDRALLEHIVGLPLA